MRKVILIMVILGLIFSYTSVVCFAEGNLLKNPSFEQGSGAKPDGWETWMYISNGSTITVENGQGHTGSKFISITSSNENDARLKQTIPVGENKIYKLSCWAKTENAGKEKTGAIISIDGYVDSSRDLKGTVGEWQNLEMYAKIGSGITSIGVTVGLGGYGNMNTGKAYFDDISVEEVSKVPDGATVAQIVKQQSNSDQSSAGDKKDSGSGSIVIILLIAAVVVIGGVAYFIFLSRRQGGNVEGDSDPDTDEYEEDDNEQDDDDSYLDDN